MTAIPHPRAKKIASPTIYKPSTPRTYACSIVLYRVLICREPHAARVALPYQAEPLPHLLKHLHQAPGAWRIFDLLGPPPEGDTASWACAV